MDRTAAKPDIVVAWYSMAGHTHALAAEIADQLGAELMEIREPRPRRGLGGLLRALLDAVRGRMPPIEAPARAPADCRILVLGGPVWASRLAAPVRRFARDHVRGAPAWACFCTLGGSGAERAFADAAALVGSGPVATLAVDSKHLDPQQHARALQTFLGVVRSYAT